MRQRLAMSTTALFCVLAVGCSTPDDRTKVPPADGGKVSLNTDGGPKTDAGPLDADAGATETDGGVDDGGPKGDAGSPTGDTCEQAIMLPGSGTYQFDSTGLTNDYDNYAGSCTHSSGHGVDMVFGVHVGLGQIVNITMTQEHGDAVLALAGSCSDIVGSCLVDEDSSASLGETISVVNTTGEEGTAFIIADFYSASDTGSPFTLEVDIHSSVCGDGIIEGTELCDVGQAGDTAGCSSCVITEGYNCYGTPSVCNVAPEGDVCETAIEVAPGTYQYDGTTFGNDYDTYGGECDGTGHGRDAVFSVTVGAGQLLTATMTAEDGDPILALAASCGDLSDSCLAREDSGSTGDPETITFMNTTAEPQTLLLVADFFGTVAAPFVLDVDVHTPVCGDGIIEGNEHCDVGPGGDTTGCAACAIVDGYRCEGAPSVCTQIPQGEICETAIPITASGSYQYDAAAFVDDYDFYYGDECDASGYGPDTAFAVTVPAGQILSLTLTPESGDAVLVLASSCEGSCLGSADSAGEGGAETLTYSNTSSADQTIIVVADFAEEGGPFALDVDLRAPVCGDGVVEVNERCDVGPGGDTSGCENCAITGGYRCTGTPSVCTLTTEGDLCSTPVEILASGSYEYDASLFGNDYSSYGGACSGSGNGPDAVFAVTVGAGEILKATMTAPSGDPVLVLSSSCSDVAASCLVRSDSGGAGETESVSYVNSTGTPQTLLLIADFYHSDDNSPFALDVDIHTSTCGDGVVEGIEQCDVGTGGDTTGCDSCGVTDGYHCTGEPSVCVTNLQGEVCTDAISIQASGTFTGSFGDFVNNYSPGDEGCTGYNEVGPDVAYRVTLQAGQTVSATLTPDADTDVAVYIVSACDDVASACLDGSDSGYDGDPETATYTATGAETVYVIVDAFDPVTTSFSLDVSIQ